MSDYPLDEVEVLSRHPFTHPRIRLWLPLMMFVALLACMWVTVPRIRPLEFLGLLFLLYVAISALVSVCEIVVVPEGLIIDRLLLPSRFVPWSAIDRVVVFAREDGQSGAVLEIASIGLYEGLSLLNRLPGPVYGQGFRQTIIITPDTLKDYDILLSTLEERSRVIRKRSHDEL